MTRLVCSLLSATWLLTSTAFCETIDYISEGFTINIPSGWRVIPQSEVAKRAQSSRAAAPAGTKIPDFRYGYQLSNDQWFSYPFVLIAITRDGRMPEAELQKLPKADLSGVTNDVRSVAKGIVSNFQFGRITYDPTTHIIWIPSEVDYPDGSKVDSLCGALQTETGSIMVYGYALPDSFDQYEPTFIKVAESIRTSDALRYKTGSADDSVNRNATGGINWRRILIAAIIGALLGGIGVTKGRKRAT